MSSCLLLSVTAITLYNQRRFSDYLDRSLEDGTVQQAKEAANNVSSILEYWLSATSIAMHNLANMTDEQFSAFLQNFLESNLEFVAFEFLSAGNAVDSKSFALTAQHDDIRLQDRTPEVLTTEIQNFNRPWIAALEQDLQSRSLFIADISAATGLPLMNIAVRFTSADSPQAQWAVLTIWQSRLLNALPNRGGLRSYVLDAAQHVVFSPASATSMAAAETEDQPLRQTLARHKAPYGFQSFTTAAGVPLLGAYAIIEKFSMSVVMTQDGRPAMAAIRNISKKTLLWSWVFLLSFVSVSFFAAGRLTRTLTQVTEATRRIANGDFSVVLKAKGKDESAVLARSVQEMAGQIVHLLRDRVDAARREQEMETARLVQSTFLPKTEFESHFVRVAGACKPASECGGDIWGYFPISPDIDCLIIADATGHGVGAALVTAMAYAGYCTFSDLMKAEAAETESPAQLLSVLNRLLWKAGAGDTVMTGFVAFFNNKTGEMRYAGAGHPPPVLLPAHDDLPRHSDAPMKADKTNCIPLYGRGDPLGMTTSAVYNNNFVVLKPNDRLVFYTDGITEGINAEAKPWGIRSFRRAIHAVATSGADQIRDQLVSSASEYFGAQPAIDDVTVVVVQVSPVWLAQDAVLAA